MTALYIILGIIAFFVLTFSVPLHVWVEYSDYMYLSVRWLFIKIKILPLEKKEKKPKKEKKHKKEKKEKPKKEEKPKEKKEGENPIITVMKSKGFDGMMEIIKNLGKALGGMTTRIRKAFVIENFDIDITVGKGDAAKTAIEYGKVCEKVFPVCGLVCSSMKVRSYNVNVEPDFLANRNSGEFSFKFYLVPQRLIHSVTVFVFEFLFKVLLKLLIGKKKKDGSSENGGSNNSGSGMNDEKAVSKAANIAAGSNK